MDSVIHFEIPADETVRAIDFYKKAFGWKVQEIPDMNYNIVHTSEIDENNMPKGKGVINGGLLKRQNQIKNIVITIGVNKIEEAIKKVKDAGGRLVAGKVEVPGMGYSAYVKDTEGNIIGLWQTIQK